MEVLKLSDKFTIYRDVYSGEFSLNDFLSKTSINHNLAIPTNNNSVWIEIETPEFSSINRQVMSNIEAITNKKFVNFAKHNWVYTQRKDFNLEWMHQHLLVHPPRRSKITSDFTFTFYLQTSNEIEGDEGMIVFQTEDNFKHKFLPNEGDIFIFPGDLRHTAIPTPNSHKERIVFAGSFCIDIYNQSSYEKNLV